MIIPLKILAINLGRSTDLLGDTEFVRIDQRQSGGFSKTPLSHQRLYQRSKASITRWDS